MIFPLFEYCKKDNCIFSGVVYPTLQSGNTLKKKPPAPLPPPISQSENGHFRNPSDPSAIVLRSHKRSPSEPPPLPVKQGRSLPGR